MIETVIHALIYICLVVLIVYVVFWVIGSLGIALPEQVVKIVWVIVGLVVLLIMLKAILPLAGIKIGELKGSTYAYQISQSGDRARL
jgi:hypothetical protein